MLVLWQRLAYELWGGRALCSTPKIALREVIQAMALTLSPAATIKFSCLDETGSNSSIILHIASATTAAAAKTAADTLAGLLAAVTDCKVLGYSISYGVEDTAITSPGAGSRVERKGRIIFEKANGGSSRLEIPSIKPALVLSDGALDGTDADLIAFLNGITGGTLYTGSDGSDLVSVGAAYEAFRGTTREQLPSRRLVM